MAWSTQDTVALSVCKYVHIPATQVLHFLTQLCLRDLFSDKYSPCEGWPVMICHVSGRVKGGEERGRNKWKKKEEEGGRAEFSVGFVSPLTLT